MFMNVRSVNVFIAVVAMLVTVMMARNEASKHIFKGISERCEIAKNRAKECLQAIR